jgi:hypothetical protein
MVYSWLLVYSIASLVPLYRSLIVGLENGNALNEEGPSLPGFLDMLFRLSMTDQTTRRQ